jgi:rubrerythrin
MEAQTIKVLEDVVRREGRSLLQYVQDAFPWTTPAELEALSQLQQIIDEERQGVAALTQFLTRKYRTFPRLGTYPSSYTTINFVSLEHLLPLLAEAERHAIPALEADIAVVKDDEAKTILVQILERKRNHLKVLEDLAQANPERFSTIRGQAS